MAKPLNDIKNVFGCVWYNHRIIVNWWMDLKNMNHFLLLHINLYPIMILLYVTFFFMPNKICLRSRCDIFFRAIFWCFSLFSLLLPTFFGTFDRFFILRFAIENVVVFVHDASAFGVSQPRILLRTISACFHIAGVGDVGILCFERQCALVWNITWFLYIRCLLAVPWFIIRKLFQWFWICDPLQCLCCGDKPNIWPKLQRNRFC